nr:retrovirus-related Pol polyprotein from transposon TNT 1-94 [Tanacetum cinerariifolium]
MLECKEAKHIKISSAEGEYVVVVGCCAQVLLIKSQLVDYDVLYDKVPIFCDNTSAITISNISVLQSRTKHIDARYHFIRDHILKGDIELHFVPTKLQLADIFTKPLAEPSFTRLVIELGMLNTEKEVSDKKKVFLAKNYVRKFLRALHPKWRAKVTAIKESKDLTSLSLDELIGNFKVYEVIIKKDSKMVKGKRERSRSLALKAKKESSDEESLTSNSKDAECEDEEYAMAISDFKKFFKRRGRDPNQLIGECLKPPRDKNQRAFVGGSYSDSDEEGNEKAKNETCLIAQASSE